jgi:branched-chain amino acid transport system substrate-binding protein
LARWSGWALPLLTLALAVIVSGCGEEGAAEGAALTVYVSAPLRGAEAEQGRRLCDEAREQAAQGRGEGDYELRVICLDASAGGGWTLAKVGSNARRATEDSTTVAYIGEPDRAARRQSRPIVEAADIAELGGISGRQAITQIAFALRDDDSNDPRAAVYDAIEG